MFAILDGVKGDRGYRCVARVLKIDPEVPEARKIQVSDGVRTVSAVVKRTPPRVST
jgi:hypothetical protein